MDWCAASASVSTSATPRASFTATSLAGGIGLLDIASIPQKDVRASQPVNTAKSSASSAAKAPLEFDESWGFASTAASDPLVSLDVTEAIKSNRSTKSVDEKERAKKDTADKLRPKAGDKAKPSPRSGLSAPLTGAEAALETYNKQAAEESKKQQILAHEVSNSVNHLESVSAQLHAVKEQIENSQKQQRELAERQELTKEQIAVLEKELKEKEQTLKEKEGNRCCS